MLPSSDPSQKKKKERESRQHQKLASFCPVCSSSKPSKPSKLPDEKPKTDRQRLPDTVCPLQGVMRRGFSGAPAVRCTALSRGIIETPALLWPVNCRNPALLCSSLSLVSSQPSSPIPSPQSIIIKTPPLSSAQLTPRQVIISSRNSSRRRRRRRRRSGSSSTSHARHRRRRRWCWCWCGCVSRLGLGR